MGYVIRVTNSVTRAGHYPARGATEAAAVDEAEGEVWPYLEGGAHVTVARLVQGELQAVRDVPRARLRAEAVWRREAAEALARVWSLETSSEVDGRTQGEARAHRQALELHLSAGVDYSTFRARLEAATAFADAFVARRSMTDEERRRFESWLAGQGFSFSGVMTPERLLAAPDSLTASQRAWLRAFQRDRRRLASDRGEASS